MSQIMHSINALSLAPDISDWLVNSHHPRILHVFEYVCNLINEHREVLSIVTPQIGNGPFNLVVDNDVLFSEHLTAESPVAVNDNQLILGDLTINKTDASLWNPCPDWEMLHANREGILNQLTQSRITSYKRYGLDCLRLDHRGLSITKYQFSNSLLAALANADLPASITATKQLAGFGHGLTPAGDDFMLGAIYSAWIIHPPEVAGVFVKEIANIAAPLTTSLSAAWLRSAGRGQAGILWHEFFDALVSANLTQIHERMDKILDVGETSGADALAGFIGSFVCWKEKAGISHD